MSVITPSFNQAGFMPRTSSSVVTQLYAPIEHVVYNPGSADESREIASNAKGVTLIAEPDKGTADAVARAQLEAKDHIIAWLNSDDEHYDENVFQIVDDAFSSPEAPDIVFGQGVYVDQDEEIFRNAHIVKIQRK